MKGEVDSYPARRLRRIAFPSQSAVARKMMTQLVDLGRRIITLNLQL
jgi:hypothetical protein